MNIINLKFLPTNVQKAQNSKKPQYFVTQRVQADTFNNASSKDQISFKGGNIYAKILNDSNLSKKFMSLIAAGAAALIAGAIGKEDKSIQEEATTPSNFEEEDFKNFVEQMFGQNQTQEVVLSKSESELEKSVINTSEEIINEQNWSDDDVYVIKPQSSKESVEENQPVLEESFEELVKFSFPKKHGRFSKDQVVLKQILEDYEFKPKTADKLTEICKVLITSKENTMEKYGFDTESLIENFTSKSADLACRENFVNELYVQYSKCLNGQNSVSETLEEPQVKIEQPSEISNGSDADGIYVPEGEQDIHNGMNVKVVGYVDLSAQKQRRTRINKENELVVETNVDSIDVKNTSYNFRIPGTLNPVYAKTYLTKIMKNFEETFTEKFYPNIVEQMRKNGVEEEKIPKYPKWKTSKPIPNNDLEKFIKNEIQKYSNNSVSGYTNITLEDAEYLTELIQFEPRFKKFFSLHAALRFIDRVVDFNSEKDPLEQIEEKLDLLFIGITKALGQNVKIDSYSQKDLKDENKIYYGSRIIIDPDEINNPELYEIAGAFPLIIGLSENQPSSEVYNYKYKTPLINTIFFKGL